MNSMYLMCRFLIAITHFDIGYYIQYIHIEGCQECCSGYFCIYSSQSEQYDFSETQTQNCFFVSYKLAKFFSDIFSNYFTLL